MKTWLPGCLSSYDTGNINASADGVNINTAVNLIRDDGGRLKINNISCDAKIKKMRAEFSGTLGYNPIRERHTQIQNQNRSANH